MHSIRRVATVIASAILLLPFLLFVGYDIFAFQTRHTEIATLISKSTPDERSLSPQVIALVRHSVGGSTAAITARILLDELRVPWVFKGQLGWHTTSALWWGLAVIHISEQEQISIIASHSYMGNSRYGFSNEAMARFHRRLSALSTPEAATLVALTKAPSRYTSSPERLSQRRDWLLSRLQNGS